jgi:uncharacterized protein YabN with tetrapyrrole methylase and pyrophosphatase domain
MNHRTVKHAICKKLIENFGEFADLSDIKSKYPEFDEVFNDIKKHELIDGTHEKARFSEVISLEHAKQICVEWHPVFSTGAPLKYE